MRKQEIVYITIFELLFPEPTFIFFIEPVLFHKTQLPLLKVSLRYSLLLFCNVVVLELHRKVLD